MNRRTITRTLGLLLVACGAGVVLSPSRLLLAQNAVKQAPMFEVDPFWPKPLPNHWVTGSTIGLSVDAQDRVWTIHRPNTVEDNFKAADLKVGDERGRDPEALPSQPGVAVADTFIGKCCKVAPPVPSMTRPATFVKSWGGPGKGFDWPESNHGISVDHQGNVWLAGNGDKDTQMLKFDGDGKFLLQIGKHGVHNGSNDVANFWKPTKASFDPSANEVYVADGYGNRRVIVFDAASGTYKRHWGAVRHQAQRRSSARVQPDRSAFETIQHRALRDGLERWLRLRLRSRQRSHPGLSQGRHVRQGSARRRPHLSVRLRVGPGVLEGPSADLYLCR